MLVERRRVVSMHKPALALGSRRFSASPAGEHAGACDRPRGNRMAAPVSVRPATLVRQARERSGGGRPARLSGPPPTTPSSNTTLQQRILHTRRHQRPHQPLSIYDRHAGRTAESTETAEHPELLPSRGPIPPIPGRRPLGQGSQPRHSTLSQQDRPRGWGGRWPRLGRRPRA